MENKNNINKLKGEKELKSQELRDITILCKVVDNFGDIGVVFRLAKSLSKLLPLVSLRIVVDNLHSFSLLEPHVDEKLDFQTVNGWQIYRWNAENLCFDAFKIAPPQIILECFQCGRPDWLEKLLFDVKIPNIVQIIMIDYLTAEDYAETFHKLMSLTRSARVQKVNFMPGFTKKTGGLLLGKNRLDEGFEVTASHTFKALFFSYPRNWKPAVKALQEFNKNLLDGKLEILLARGAGFESFANACKEISKNQNSFFKLNELSFMPQNEWDELLAKTPLLFIRGEDSMAQACLCGVPFVWHAYHQSEEYQLIKVQALLNKMRQHFSDNNFKYVEKCWQIYNKTNANEKELEKALYDFLSHYYELKKGFADFSKSLKKNGDMAENLVVFIKERLQNDTEEVLNV